MTRHVVMAATRAGELLYHSRPLDERIALLLAAEIRAAAAGCSGVVGPVVMLADRQDDGTDNPDRARP